jgi:phage terminase large subunit
MAAVWGIVEPLRILCVREFQGSIKESFHAELKNAIASEPGLEAAYEVGVDYIRGKNGTDFLFKGLRHNTSSVKSTAQVDLCIIEEAEDVPEHAWIELLPTIRAPKSEVWVIWNPKRKGSPVDARFRQSQAERACIVEMNYSDNPWFPDVLNEQRLGDRDRMSPEEYAHVWEGAYLEHSDAQVFKGKWRTGEFEPQSDWDGPYNGLDFGFSQDPTAAVECFIHDRKLYVSRCAGKVGLELDDTATFICAKIPSAKKTVIRADSARPESISYLRRNGLPFIAAVKKWKGSVEDGISFMKSFDEIVVHERCRPVAQEFTDYSYKVDRLTKDILPAIVDANNHYIDAIRYALDKAIQMRYSKSLRDML